MKNYIANNQTVLLNNPILFNSSNCQCRGVGAIYHDNGSGVFILSGRNCNNMSAGNEYQVTFNGNIAIPTGGTVGPIAVAIVINGEADVSSRSIFTPAAVDEYGNVTSTTVIKVPKCCGCFSVSVEYVSGLVDDPAGVPAPTILVQNGNLTIDGKVA
jgi:hypothetical protein